MFDDYGFEPQYEPRKRNGALVAVVVLLIVLVLSCAIVVAAGTGVFDRMAALFGPSNSPAAQYSPHPSATGGPMPSLGGTVKKTGDKSIPDIVDEITPSVVRINNMVVSKSGQQSLQGSGSGVIISQEGHIVTNAHVIADADSISVVLWDEREVKAVLVGKSERNDLAVLKVNIPDLTPAPLGSSDNLRVGETAIAFGSPLELVGTVTAGVISGLERVIVSETTGFRMSYLQTDAAINPGNSGGPLVNGDGEVIGINTRKSVIAGYTENGRQINAEGIGFAIPIDQVITVVEQIIREGYVSRPGIGISGWDLSQEMAAEVNMVPGLWVRSVAEDGTAKIAGIQVNDVIHGINGKELLTYDEFSDELTRIGAGNQAELMVWRDGQELKIKVEIGLLIE